jgi:regulator of sigma E protease
LPSTNGHGWLQRRAAGATRGDGKAKRRSKVSTFIGIIVGIVGLGFLILVHEFGHFMVAKATGMRVEEFSLGFGPYIVSRRWGETTYGISAVPLGGYVRVTGMHKEEFDRQVAEARAREAGEWFESTGGGPQDPEDRLAGKRALSAAEIAATPLHRRYYAHPFWHKLLFIVAGVAMNMLVAFALLWIVGSMQGESWQTTEVAKVEAGSGAAGGGIQVGDRIVSMDGHETATWNDLKWEILKRKNELVSVVVLRDGETKDLEVQVGQRDGLAYLGVSPSGVWEHKDLGPGQSFVYAASEIKGTIVMIFEGIGMMFSRDVPATGSEGLAGPVGIVQISKDALASGLAPYLGFLALISINLALLNMLPLLPLDGGHVVMTVIERIRGRSISLRVFERVSMIGLALFGVIFMVAIYNDVGRIFTGY